MNRTRRSTHRRSLTMSVTTDGPDACRSCLRRSGRCPRWSRRCRAPWPVAASTGRPSRRTPGQRCVALVLGCFDLVEPQHVPLVGPRHTLASVEEALGPHVDQLGVGPRVWHTPDALHRADLPAARPATQRVRQPAHAHLVDRVGTTLSSGPGVTTRTGPNTATASEERSCWRQPESTQSRSGVVRGSFPRATRQEAQRKHLRPYVALARRRTHGAFPRT